MKEHRISMEQRGELIEKIAKQSLAEGSSYFLLSADEKDINIATGGDTNMLAAAVATALEQDDAAYEVMKHAVGYVLNRKVLAEAAKKGLKTAKS